MMEHETSSEVGFVDQIEGRSDIENCKSISQLHKLMDAKALSLGCSFIIEDKKDSDLIKIRLWTPRGSKALMIMREGSKPRVSGIKNELLVAYTFNLEFEKQQEREKELAAKVLLF